MQLFFCRIQPQRWSMCCTLSSTSTKSGWSIAISRSFFCVSALAQSTRNKPPAADGEPDVRLRRPRLPRLPHHQGSLPTRPQPGGPFLIVCTVAARRFRLLRIPRRELHEDRLRNARVQPPSHSRRPSRRATLTNCPPPTAAARLRPRFWIRTLNSRPATGPRWTSGRWA